MKKTIELPIAALRNPLGDPFDLSECGDTGQHLHFATGCRQAQNPLNADKVEIWLMPWFLAIRTLNIMPTNHHIREIITGRNWNGVTAPIGIFWTLGIWENLSNCDYVTTLSMDDISTQNLHTIWQTVRPCIWSGVQFVGERARAFAHFTFELK